VLPGNIDLKDQNMLEEEMESLFNRKAERIFEFNEVDFSDIMRIKVNIGIKLHLYKMLQWSYQLHYFIQRFGIRILISPFGRGMWYILAELLYKTGGISLFVSHGTHPVPRDKFHEISIFNMCRGFMLGDYSHIALSTPVQEAHLHYFKNKYGWIKNNEVKTGPLIFASVSEADRIRNRKSLGFQASERVIIHAVSLKWRGGERYYFLETMDEYLSGLADIVDAVNRIANAKLVIRLHQGFDLTNEELSLFLPKSDKYIVNKSGQFENVLSAADLLISYSSTTIDEALINKIPVLLYDKWNRYNHFKTGIFENQQSYDVFPVCYVNRQDKLHDAIKYMFEKIKTVEKEDIDVDKYKYREEYKDNFYGFIEESLKMKGGDS
jgi:hypothetical protein